MVALMSSGQCGFGAVGGETPDRSRHRTTVSEALATIVAAAAGVYLGCGLVFASAFVWRGAARVDPAAREGTLGFRLIIVAGVTLLWPLLAARWASGSSHPPRELNAHRRLARSRTVA
jgi:hypothetical protein